jgi:hypothetical protein
MIDRMMLPFPHAGRGNREGAHLSPDDQNLNGAN